MSTITPTLDGRPGRASLRAVAPWVIGLALLAAIVVGALAAADRFGADTADETITVPATATVTMGDLVESASWDGVLGYASAGELTHRADPVTTTSISGAGRDAVAITTESPGGGVLTSLADQGSIVGAGDVLYRVDDAPVVLLEGDAVLWRTLGEGDEGTDVEAIETALVAGGYDPDGTVTVDTTYTSATAAMVERFQEDVGQPVTGALEWGTVVMAPGPVRVGEHLAEPGAEVVDGSAVLVLSSTEREVSFAIDPETRGWIATGDAIEVRLPDRSTVEATVISISPTVDDTGTYVGRATVSGDGGYTSDRLDVAVLASVVLAEDALTVPPDALIAIEGGGYQVRTLVGETERRVDVTVVGDAGRLVAVEGTGLEAGTIVVVP